MIEALLLGGPKNGEVMALERWVPTIVVAVTWPGVVGPWFREVEYRYIGESDGMRVYEAP